MVCFVLGFWGPFRTFIPNNEDVAPGYLGDQAKAIGWYWLALSLSNGFAALRLLRRSPRGPALCLSTGLITLGSIIGGLAALYPDDILGRMVGPIPTQFQKFVWLLSLNKWSTWLFFPILGISVKPADVLLFDQDLRTWASSPVRDDRGFVSQRPGDAKRNRLWFWVGTCLPATLLFLLWWALDAVLNPLIEAAGWVPRLGSFLWDASGWFANNVLVSLPFLAGVGFVIWRLTESVTIDESGVRLFLFRPKYTMFSAPWSRISSVHVVRHRRREATAVVYYRSRWRVPYSLGLAPKRFANGSDMVDEVLDQAKRRGVAVREWYSPDWMPGAAWAFILLGAGLVAGQQVYSSMLYTEFMRDGFPLGQFNRIAGVVPLTALALAAVVVFSIGLGMLSAYQRGGSRIFMLGAWMCSITTMPTPVLHWLVWIAIFNILSAIRYPFGAVQVPPPPPQGIWNFAFTALAFAPAVGALAYWAGIGLGRRRA